MESFIYNILWWLFTVTQVISALGLVAWIYTFFIPYDKKDGNSILKTFVTLGILILITSAKTPLINFLTGG